MKLILTTLLVLTAGDALFAQKEQAWNPDTTFPALSPAEEIKTIEGPKGHKLVCIASEPMVEEPASFAFDGNGASHESPDARIHALWALQGLGALEKETVLAAIKHENPRVRRAAIQLAEPRLLQRDAGISTALTALAADPDAQVATQVFLAPQLTKSAWFSNGGNVPVLARVLLKGQTGPIDGVSCDAGLMPPVENSHTDAQIAQVLSYVGERWHAWKTPADIARARQETADRKTPWTHEELMTLGKPKPGQ